MGVEVRPIFEPRVRGLVYQAEGKVLADALDGLLAFSEEQGLRSITDFMSMSEDEDDEEGQIEWHSPSEGVEAVRALAEAIRADPDAAEKWNEEDPDGLETLLDDLDELVRCLEVAAGKGVKFRLDVG